MSREIKTWRVILWSIFCFSLLSGLLHPRLVQSSPRIGQQNVSLLARESPEKGASIRRYILEVASHDPGNTSDITNTVRGFLNLVAELEPFLVSLKKFRVTTTHATKARRLRHVINSKSRNTTQQRRSQQYVSDLALWRKGLMQQSQRNPSLSRNLKDDDKPSDIPRGSRRVNSAIWVWRTLRFLQSESPKEIRGSCQTVGWKNSSSCAAATEVNRRIDNLEVHVGFSLEPEDLSSQILRAGKEWNNLYTSERGPLFIVVDLDTDLAKKLGMIEGIAAIEQNRNFHSLDSCGIEGERCSRTSQTEELWWNLDRLNQRNSGDGRYTWSDCDDGSNSVVYVLDTGIRVSHEEFENRALLGLNGFDLSLNSEDSHGHGTHVAGTIAGKIYGVAKRATVVSVKVLNNKGEGSTQSILNGVEWTRSIVMDSYVEDLKHRRRVRRSIMNLSFGTSAVSTSINRVLERLTNLGVVSIAAAGNENQNACNTSPASNPRSITVAASTSGDVKASFSNFGPCVDLFAPGTNIKSASNKGDSDFAKLQGTSMAAPVVAGLVARHLTAFPFATPDEVASSVSCSATGKLFGGAHRDNGVSGLSEFPFTASLLTFYPESCSLNVSLSADSPDRRDASSFMELVYWPVLRDRLAPRISWPIDGVYGATKDFEQCVGRPCVSQCSQVGSCRNGHCACPCDRVGLECEDKIEIHDLQGPTGEVTASNVVIQNNGSYEAYNVFSFPSPDWWFFIPINPSMKSISLNTCSADTNFPTVLYVVSTCPHFGGTPYRVEGLGHNVSNNNWCGHGANAARVFISLTEVVIVENDYGRKGLFGMIEGWGTAEGTFELSWQISTYGPEVSVSPTRPPIKPNFRRVTITPIATLSPSRTATRSITPSGTSRVSSTRSPSPSSRSSKDVSPTSTMSPSKSFIATSSSTSTASATGSPTLTQTQTRSPAPSSTKTSKTSNTPPVSPSPTTTQTFTQTRTRSPNSSSTATAKRSSLPTPSPSSTSIVSTTSLPTLSETTTTSSTFTKNPEHVFKESTETLTASASVTPQPPFETTSLTPSQCFAFQTSKSSHHLFSYAPSSATRTNHVSTTPATTVVPTPAVSPVCLSLNGSSHDKMTFRLLSQFGSSTLNFTEVSNQIVHLLDLANGIENFYPRPRNTWRWNFSLKSYLIIKPSNITIGLHLFEFLTVLESVPIDKDGNAVDIFTCEDFLEMKTRRMYDALFPESPKSLRPGLANFMASRDYGAVEIIDVNGEDRDSFIERSSRFGYTDEATEQETETSSSDGSFKVDKSIAIVLGSLVPVAVGLLGYLGYYRWFNRKHPHREENGMEHRHLSTRNLSMVNRGNRVQEMQGDEVVFYTHPVSSAMSTAAVRYAMGQESKS